MVYSRAGRVSVHRHVVRTVEINQRITGRRCPGHYSVSDWSDGERDPRADRRLIQLRSQGAFVRIANNCDRNGIAALRSVGVERVEGVLQLGVAAIRTS